MSEAQVRHWCDLSFAVRMSREDGGHTVQFKVYEIVSADPEYVYRLTDYTSGLDVTNNLDEAQVYVSGNIKCDGCSNFNFDEQDVVALHFCGKSDAARIGILIGRLYELAEELMPEHADEIRAA